MEFCAKTRHKTPLAGQTTDFYLYGRSYRHVDAEGWRGLVDTLARTIAVNGGAVCS